MTAPLHMLSQFCARYGLLSAGLALIACSSAAQQTSGPYADDFARATRIARLANSAKAQGKSTLILPSTEGMPTGVGTIDKVVENYSVIVVEPVTQVTVPDGLSLITWYKFKIVDRLFTQRSTDTSPLPATIPPGLTPLKPDEILIPIDGGDLVVNDVAVRQANPFNFKFKAGLSYVLVVFLENSGQLANLAADAGSAYVKGKDDSLTSLSNRPAHLAKDLHDRYQNQFSLLQSDLASRPH